MKKLIGFGLLGLISSMGCQPEDCDELDFVEKQICIHDDKPPELVEACYEGLLNIEKCAGDANRLIETHSLEHAVEIVEMCDQKFAARGRTLACIDSMSSAEYDVSLNPTKCSEAFSSEPIVLACIEATARTEPATIDAVQNCTEKSENDSYAVTCIANLK